MKERTFFIIFEKAIIEVNNNKKFLEGESPTLKVQAFVIICHTDRRFVKSIFKPLYLKYRSYAHVQLTIICWYILFINFLTWCQLETYIEDTLVLMTSWMCLYEFSWKYFLDFNFLLEVSTSTPAIKLMCGRNNFSKKVVNNLQTRMFSEKVTWNKVNEWTKFMKSLTNFTHQRLSLMEVSTSYLVRKLVNSM